MLICDELVKKYYSCTAVDHVNMRLDDGKVYAMLGPNGRYKFIMKFFIDTAKVEDIKKANDMGVICGVTTNPSLIAKEGRDFKEVIAEIASIVDGPISGEVKATTQDAEGMIKEGREIAGYSNKYQAIIAPIDIAGERLGTLFMYKIENQYDIDDIILCEYGTTVVGLEMMRSVNEETAEEDRKVHIVKSAISTLSYSELEAIIHIFDELGQGEGILVASRIADKVGITRSVIVNALRKFESAGVIESRSSGMKGTYIKVLNDVVFDELARIKMNM